ncbi:unnamed protein product [Schistosoma margrebowiei]|uniref:Uncharacterized protein n=1 Tax=Schistosoma margrebowiei TaxID=48269 RepID=A0A183LWX1_9TREM|nr:unnamed protein product [Schistosoma margrebowiei]
MVGGSQQETLDLGIVLLGTHQQVVPVFLRELVFLDGSDPVSPSFTVRDVTAELSGRRLTSQYIFCIHDNLESYNNVS